MRRILATAILPLALAASAPAMAQGLYPYADARYGTTALVPAGWRALPAERSWEGSRFVSPDGQGWLAVYGRPEDGMSIDQHIARLTRAPGERVTYVRRGRNWLVISGYKGRRIFYRKAILACGGRMWHHVALEYPAERKRAYDRIVTAISHSLDRRSARCN